MQLCFKSQSKHPEGTSSTNMSLEQSYLRLDAQLLLVQMMVTGCHKRIVHARPRVLHDRENGFPARGHHHITWLHNMVMLVMIVCSGQQQITVRMGFRREVIITSPGCAWAM